MSKIKANWKLYGCAFLLPFAIAVVICIKNGVYPFGENCILHIDMYHQYEPFFTEFMDKLKHGKSLMYSFRLGLGSDFVSLFAYYLASPWNWLLFLWPSDYVIEFMTLLILLKIGLCGLSFEAYLKHHFNRMDFGGILFASAYALSGYMAAYSWNIMWLDCLVLAPLAILGLEKMVKEGNCKLYVISLAAAVLSNFYIAFMLCVFLVFWFLILIVEEAKGRKERMLGCGRFVLYSLIAGGMGAVLILPEAAILGYSGSSGFSFPKKLEWYFDLVSMLARHCIGVESYTGRNHWPNLYCGSAVFLLIALYLFNRSIPWKKKLKRVLLIVFFWIGFANNLLDFFWHGLHFPDSLPGRQAFLYVFLLLTMAYEGYLYFKENKWTHIGIGVILTEAFLILAAFASDCGMVSGDALALTGILTAGYGVLFFVCLYGRRNTRYFSGCLIFFLAVTELFVNFDMTGLSVTSRVSYTKNWDSVKDLLERVNEQDQAPFYRVEEMERLTKNEAAVYGYASSTIFSSLMNIGVSRFYRLLGMEGGKNFYSYSGATPLSSAMLSVKYLISNSPEDQSPLRTLVADDGKNYIYENWYCLPLGFMMDVDFESRWNAIQREPVNNLNNMAKALGANEDLLVLLPEACEAQEEKTRITVSEDAYLYGTYVNTSVTNLTVKNQKRERKFTKCDHGYILDLGWCKAGDELEITNTSGVSEFKVEVYKLNLDALNQAYAKLSEQTLELSDVSDTKLEGSIHVKTPGNLILSIPQEEGWSVWIDGKEVKGEMFMESFMKIPLIRGEHQVALRYKTPGLVLGAAISLGSLACFLLLAFVLPRRLKK